VIQAAETVRDKRDVDSIDPVIQALERVAPDPFDVDSIRDPRPASAPREL
jgi:hypothetical protein